MAVDLPLPSRKLLVSTAALETDLTKADRLVLRNLLQDKHGATTTTGNANHDFKAERCDEQTLRELKDLTRLEPAVFTNWDNDDLPAWFKLYILQPYITHAKNLVRRDTDIVFITHLLILSTIGIPNMVSLFLRFNWIQAIFQWAFVAYFTGPYSILMHNYIHGRGILSKCWATADTLFPYILGPMMGQTWNSFHYHHRHHHIEENGPDDLSSTLRYQRDSVKDFTIYVGRFLLLNWIELPLYYIRKGSLRSAFRFFAWEMLSYAFIFIMAKVNFAATMMTMVLPLIQLRIALMADNWGQHALVDENDPDSKLKSSITVIDVVVCSLSDNLIVFSDFRLKANRHGFNDGYHTSHHLLPARHWSEHPHAFIKAKQEFASGGALTFQGLDFIKLTFLLFKKNYNHIAECLLPMGEQIGMTKEEVVSMLRKKTKKFSADAIMLKFK
jgi:phosphoinositide-3-kinase regulatory subunit 4